MVSVMSFVCSQHSETVGRVVEAEDISATQYIDIIIINLVLIHIL